MVLKQAPQGFDRNKVSAVEKFVTNIDVLPARYQEAKVCSRVLVWIGLRVSIVFWFNKSDRFMMSGFQLRNENLWPPLAS
jgi:hypothetical protein